MTDIVGYGYAAVVALGGIIGYVKAGSIMSLTAGLVFGGAAAFGAMQTSKNPANYMIILGTSFALSCLMGYRYANSGKFMPAGLVAALSLMMVIRYGSRMYSA
ncbi:Transmembrane protein 14C [Holothuria leucospilota]|uniref:Transmembrane protein 14C n=1 Tax=Holothuria leucospilota TaxID=206669 RepID=A0A9Q1BWK7_HOLLE|nr:Transmembrane protein 14C [Holothuria leucospilota]